MEPWPPWKKLCSLHCEGPQSRKRRQRSPSASSVAASCMIAWARRHEEDSSHAASIPSEPCHPEASCASPQPAEARRGSPSGGNSSALTSAHDWPPGLLSKQIKGHGAKPETSTESYPFAMHRSGTMKLDCTQVTGNCHHPPSPASAWF